jgi:hypothetical protein
MGLIHILIINWSLLVNLVLHHLVGLLLKLLIKLIFLVLLIILLLSLWPCHLNIWKKLLSLINLVLRNKRLLRWKLLIKLRVIKYFLI